jgi:hypothetical protein
MTKRDVSDAPVLLLVVKELAVGGTELQMLSTRVPGNSYVHTAVQSTRCTQTGITVPNRKKRTVGQTAVFLLFYGLWSSKIRKP